MKKEFPKKVLVVASLFCLLVAFKAYSFGHGKGKAGSLNFEKKFSYKAEFILKNREELGLSVEQVDKIEGLQIKVEKDLIRKAAEMDILALDMKEELREDPVNVGAVNKLLDKKYNLKKEKAKLLAGAYVALKNTLTPEQKGKLGSLFKDCKKGIRPGSGLGSKKNCPMLKGMKGKMPSGTTDK